MKTLVVNLFGGPGVGKSTGAAYIFSKLKLLGINCEYVPEFTKECVWEGDQFPLKHCQLKIIGEQSLRINRLLGKVDVIVTDSPLLLTVGYTDEKPYHDICVYESKKQNSLNIVLNRVAKYNPVGRNESEKEAKEVDNKIMKFLKDNEFKFTVVDGNEEGFKKVVNMIVEWFEN